MVKMYYQVHRMVKLNNDQDKYHTITRKNLTDMLYPEVDI